MFASLFRTTASSVAFLSRLPVPAEWLGKETDFTQTAHTFPLAGLIIALPAALVVLGADVLGLQPVVAAILALAALIIATGALHEDGLADLADGFWGGHTKQRKLEIMRDSAIGTYGVIALILTFSLRTALYTQLIAGSGAGYAAVLLLIAASLSRFSLLYPWSTLPTARTGTDGAQSKGKEAASLSARFGVPDQTSLFNGAVLSLPAIALLAITTGIAATLISLLLLVGAVTLVNWLSMKHIGGRTGDTLGATQQMSELGLLLGFVLTM